MSEAADVLSKDRHGVDHEIAPFSQVRSRKYGLLNKLKSLPSFRGKSIQLSHSVCFLGSAKPQSAVRPEAGPGDHYRLRRPEPAPTANRGDSGVQSLTRWRVVPTWRANCL